MTTLESLVPAYLNADYGNSGKLYVYNLKLDTNIKKGVESVSVPSIFRDLMKTMTAAASHPIVFSDVTKTIVSTDKPPGGITIQDRFRVKTVPKKNRKVVMGFGLETKTPILTLKYRMMEYLNEKKVFIQVHTSGFDHGVCTTFLGFLVDDNPDTTDIQQLEADLSKSLQKYWMSSTHLTSSDRTTLIKKYGTYLSEGHNNLPIHVKKNKITAMNSQNKKVETKALIVSTPVKFAHALKNMFDGMVVVDKSIPHFIPADLRKEEPETFYNITATQAKFLHQHRNIPINGVDYDIFVDESKTGMSFESRLVNHVDIHHVYYDVSKKRVNISTTATKYMAVKAWIDSKITERVVPFETKKFYLKGSIKKIKAAFPNTPIFSAPPRTPALIRSALSLSTTICLKQCSLHCPKN